MITECERFRENLTAYLDKELNPAESAAMRSHLESCTSCSEELGSLRESTDFIGSHISELELRPGSWTRVQARISEEHSPSRFLFPVLNRWRVGFAAILFMAAIALGYLWHQQIQQQNLDEYISQYVRAREAGEHIRHLIGKTGPGILESNAAAYNPFIEVKATLDANPFRSEDR